MSRGRHRRTSRRGPVAAAALLLLAAVALAVPGASGGFLARVTNNANTASTASYFTCAAAEQSPGAASSYFTYPLGEAAGVVANDISGNTRIGTYTATGVTYGVANGGVCPRDNRTVVTLDGSTGYVSGPVTAIPGPTTFSVEVWFRTTVAKGKLIGFGDARTGQSASYDRHIYLSNAGKLIFGVFPNDYKMITGGPTVTDGNWHQAVATLSPTAGMALYVDGAVAATDPNVKTAQSFNGYWRIGYDNLNTWSTYTATTGPHFFQGSMAFAAAYSTALTATQVAQHYVAGR